MNVCGLWQGSHRLAAVIANDDGTLRLPITTPATPDHTRHLLDYLVTAGIDTLILAERSHFLIAQAQTRQLHVRLVPHGLLEGIRDATAIKHRPPRHTAVLLARWPFTPALRLHLREARPAQPQKDQLALF
jgi:hypothetical protein